MNQNQDPEGRAKNCGKASPGDKTKPLSRKQSLCTQLDFSNAMNPWLWLPSDLFGTGVYGVDILYVRHHYVLAVGWGDNVSLQFTGPQTERNSTEGAEVEEYTHRASFVCELDLDKILQLGPESDAIMYLGVLGVRGCVYMENLWILCGKKIDCAGRFFDTHRFKRWGPVLLEPGQDVVTALSNTMQQKECSVTLDKNPCSFCQSFLGLLLWRPPHGVTSWRNHI